MHFELLMFYSTLGLDSSTVQNDLQNLSGTGTGFSLSHEVKLIFIEYTFIICPLDDSIKLFHSRTYLKCWKNAIEQLFFRFFLYFMNREPLSGTRRLKLKTTL
jgi:hypothetical protein